jgi:hypothetical protein
MGSTQEEAFLRFACAAAGCQYFYEARNQIAIPELYEDTRGMCAAYVGAGTSPVPVWLMKYAGRDKPCPYE